MPRFYRGAGIGTYWHDHDPRTNGGFQPHYAGVHDVADFIDHIARATTSSPYISLTRSYEVAEEYARFSSRTVPTKDDPAYVYEIDLSDPLPAGIHLYDPLNVIAGVVPGPLAQVCYQHDGGQGVIVGLAQPNSPRGQKYLTDKVKLPGGMRGVAGPKVVPELNALVRAIRDAEVLCLGTIPARFIVKVHPVPPRVP